MLYLLNIVNIVSGFVIGWEIVIVRCNFLIKAVFRFRTICCAFQRYQRLL